MASLNLEETIRENKRRLEENNRLYDPITGTEYSQEMKRNVLEVQDAPLSFQNIPIEMEEEDIVKLLRQTGSLSKSGSLCYGGVPTEKKSVEIWRLFVNKRCKHDFEFWCVTQATITHKTLATVIPFVLNRAQRIYLVELESLRKAGVAIDIILLKARQWGGSTLTQFYMLWIQLFWRKNWNSVICADVDDQAKGVLGMIMGAAERYDTFITEGQKLILKPYMKTDSTRVIYGRGCTVSVGSAQHPEKIRSQNISMAHLTEVGLWKATPSKKPEDLVQSIFGSIVSNAYTLKILESTAKGVGNYFHRTWLDAVRGENNFKPVFIAWFMIDIYQKEVDNYEEFIESMNGYENMLFELGATLEQINWYRSKLKEMKDKWRMCSEYPSTPEEAFQSTGNNYFPAEYVNEMYKSCTEPKRIGEIVGEELKGESSLIGLRMLDESNGKLKMWLDVDKSVKMKNRYLVIVDLGKGHTDKSDNSIICVFDRYWMHEAGGIPEVAAEWAGHIDIDILAWKAAQIATYYDNALLVVESNTTETSTVDNFRTVLSEIAGVYENLYRRTKEEQLVEGAVIRYGFHTNSSTKPMICATQLECVRDGLYIERCREAVDEHKVFEEKDGKLGAVEGCHDDRVITRCIGNYFNYKIMPAPTFENNQVKATSSKKIINEYTI